MGPSDAAVSCANARPADIGHVQRTVQGATPEPADFGGGLFGHGVVVEVAEADIGALGGEGEGGGPPDAA